MPFPKSVTVVVYGAKSLKPRKGDGIPLAWVVFGFGKNKCCTAQVRERNPKWNEENTFAITDPKVPLKLTVKDKDDTLGQIRLPLIDIPYEEHTFKWMPIGPHRKNLNPCGEICIDCWIVDYKEGVTPKKDTNFLKMKQKLNFRQLTDRRGSLQTGAISMKGSVSVEDLSSRQFRKSSVDNISLNPITISSGLMRPSSVHMKKFDFSSPISKSPTPTDISPKFENENVTEIKYFTPICGPASGGTMVHITGKYLGNRKEDIIALKIGASDCLATLEYHSPNKLVCTTVPGHGVGPILVTTESGGTGTSKLNYEFEEANMQDMANGYTMKDVSEKKEQANTSEKKNQSTRRFSLGGKNQEKKSTNQDLKKEVEELTTEVQVLKNENAELKQYVDKLLLYLMEKYPEALESRRLYR